MDLNEYVKQDRQWPRELRIAHAAYQIIKAKTSNELDFWKKVLAANED